MKKTLSILAILVSLPLSLLLNTGCATMYFHNGYSTSENLERRVWKNDAFFGFIAFGNPVPMNGCKEGWGTVSDEKNFFQGVFTLLTADLYDPWDAGFACRKTLHASSLDRVQL